MVSIQGRGRPTKEQVKRRIEFPDSMAAEILQHRRQLLVDDGAKVLLLVSLSSNEMVELVSMHPEVWFMDVTAKVNKQNLDMFMLAIRTPAGTTFPGNVTFIPSGKRWVFECIYRYAFVALFGSITCSRNRLALFDEDNAEYGPFDHCIKCLPEYKNSRVMICVFHAVWMPFKKDIFPMLSKKFSNSKGLTKTGKLVGKIPFHIILMYT